MNHEAPTPFPWDNVMQFGFSVLRLSSEEFWSMTPREIAFAMRSANTSKNKPISRSGLDHLLQQFPDQRIDE